MKSSVWLIGAGLMGAALQAQAAGDVRAAIGSGIFELEGDGDKLESDSLTSFDFRATFKPTDNIFVRGQYMLGSSDKIEIEGDKYDVDTDIDVLRLAVGYGANVSEIRLYGAVEYVDLTLEISGGGESIKGDDNGVAITGGIGDQGTGKWLWNVELSLIKLDELDGASLEASVGYRFTPAFSVGGGLQSYAFEDSDDYEYNFGQLYIGAQLSF